ncbi:MAG TPA: hypothetical protein VED01_12955 [Burkholderiales bacterium]|nr:hypothetical protein [Burkholderiales bacterium]
MLQSNRLEGPDDAAALFTHMVALGITDGLPVIPPTERNVQEMIDYVRLPADAVIATIPPENGAATVEKLAINAVMAGCLPEYFPVVIAAVRAVADPAFDLLGIQTTTNPVAPVLLVNGPIRNEIGIACGRGCMGPGFRANATIGRALKLALLNIGACPPGEVSKSIHGYPGRFAFCFGELEEESPWEPFHVEMGFDAKQSTVTVFGGQGTQNLYASFTTPEGIVHMTADGMRCYGNNGYLRGVGTPVVVITPGHARIFSAAGWDKRRIKEALFKLTPIPLSHVSSDRQVAHPVYENWERDRMLQVCRDAANIVIVVAGGAEPYHLTYIPSFTHPDKVIIKPIE